MKFSIRFSKIPAYETHRLLNITPMAIRLLQQLPHRLHAHLADACRRLSARTTHLRSKRQLARPPSPDNKIYIAHLSDKQQNHLLGKTVQLILMNLATKAVKDLTPPFYGGQGTINLPSWSADSWKAAFVSYQVR